MHASELSFVIRESRMWPNGGMIWIVFDKVDGMVKASIRKLYNERRIC